MVNLSYDPFQATGASSGTANVPNGQSTGSQYQGADIADDLFFPLGQGVSGSSVTQVTLQAPVAFASGIYGSIGSFSGGTSVSGALLLIPGSGSILFTVGGTASSSGHSIVGSSGGGSGDCMVAWSGFTPQGSIVAANSGAFAPVGCLIIQVPTSGNPTVKVPFFLS